MISPDVQRLAITDYSRTRGYDVCGWLEGIDESGSRARSAWWPRLEQAVASVEAGEYDVVVVWKFSRTARNRLKWAAAIDRVEAVGGRLESATEQIDVTTSAGRFTRGMFGEMAAFEAERIGEGWKEAHAKRVSDGKPANGKPRFGYVYDLEAKVHVPDPVTGPVLADAYRRYVAGESVYQLVRWLNGRGWRTTGGGLWSDRSLRRVMDSGFASGRFLAGGDVRRGVAPVLREGVHEALISEELWQAYLDARAVRRGRPARAERSQYVLSGLVRCARCGGPMVAGQFGREGVPKYRCSTSKEKGSGACAGGYVMASYVEAHVLGWLQGVADAVDERSARVGAVAPVVVSARAQEEVLARQIARADEALTRLVVQNAEDPLPEGVYRSARAELEDRIAGLTEALEAVRRDARRAPVDRRVAAASLLESWDQLLVSGRREVLRGLMDCVLVTTGRPRATFRVVDVWEIRPLGVE